MEIAKISQNGHTLFLVKAEDLQEYGESIAYKILEQYSKQVESKPEIEQPISQTEAVKFLGKSRQTLIAWRKKGVIKAYRLGGRVYYKPSELVSALDKLGE